jgi:alpha-N-arabinofuranosidase
LVDCKKYNTPEFFIGLGEKTTQQNDVPYLDVSATYQNGEIVLNVVNRNKEEAITTDIISQNGPFSGDFSVSEVNGPDIKTVNDFGKELIKTVERPAIRASGNKFTYAFPPHSFTMIKGRVAK